jgi:general secretion pathway protein H
MDTFFNLKKGFTLLELMVVLGLISMISVLVVPRLAGSLSKMNGETAARKIAASLRYARSQAVSQKIPYFCRFDFDKNRLIVKNWQAEPGNLETESRKLEKIYDLPEGVKLEEVIAEKTDAGVFQIAFYPAGNSSGGEVIISDERERRYKIETDFITGTVKLLSD